jgi:hypothetical protein
LKNYLTETAMTNLKYFFLTAACLLFSAGALAQHNEQVTVEGTYRPKVNQVDKILIKPEMPKQAFSLPQVQIDVLDFDYKFKMDLEALSPIPFSVKSDQTAATENFLMAAFGSRISPVFLYKHNSQLTRNMGLGVGVNHSSSWLNIKNYAPSSYMNNEFNVELSNKFDDYQLYSKLFYKNDMCHYYGYELGDYIIPENLVDTYCPKQTYNTVGFGTKLSSTDTHLETLQHEIGLNYHYTFDKFGAREHEGDLTGFLSYSNKWLGSKIEPQTLGADLDFSFNRYGLTNESCNRMLFKFNPYLAMKGDFYKLRLGFSMDIANADSSSFSIRPDLSASLFVFDKKVEFYAGLNGGRRIYSYNDIIEENPFVQSVLPLGYKNVKLDFEAGLRTNILQIVDFHLGVRYHKTANDMFFVPNSDSLLQNFFTTVYDRTNEFKLLANLRFKVLDNLHVQGSFGYNKYDLETFEFAWYKPAMEAALKADFVFMDKMLFSFGGSYYSGRHAAHFVVGNLEAIDLKGIIDLNLSCDYKINEQLTAFVKFGNILNDKYMMFYDYPIGGIEAFAGVKMCF